MRRKNYLAIDLIINGSRQDYLELNKIELQRLSEALGQAVPNYDGIDKVPFLRLMRKIDNLLDRWNEELKVSK